MTSSPARTATVVASSPDPIDELTDVLNQLRPVSLAAVVSTADLQTRKDRKYLVPMRSLPAVVETVAGLQVLSIDGRRRFGYRSTYFDTPVLESYLAAARRRPRRYKVRTRHYVDSNLCRLEVKTRDRRGRTVKRRIDCTADEARDLSGDGRAFVSSIPETGDVAGVLAPTLTVGYDRATLLIAPGSSTTPVDPSRVTIDTDVGGVCRPVSAGCSVRWPWSRPRRRADPALSTGPCGGTATAR